MSNQQASQSNLARIARPTATRQTELARGQLTPTQRQLLNLVEYGPIVPAPLPFVPMEAPQHEQVIVYYWHHVVDLTGPTALDYWAPTNVEIVPYIDLTR